jgi:hypothetical protein
MTDKQVLAHYRDRDQNPYMTMGTAKALHGLSMKFGYLGAAIEKAREQETRDGTSPARSRPPAGRRRR